jgi:hypothetical protein
MTTLTLVRPDRTCPTWCVAHDRDADVCSTATTHLTFATAIRGGETQAGVILAASDDGTSIHPILAGVGYALSVDGAEAFAWAILAKVEAARNGDTR